MGTMTVVIAVAIAVGGVSPRADGTSEAIRRVCCRRIGRHRSGRRRTSSIRTLLRVSNIQCLVKFLVQIVQIPIFRRERTLQWQRPGMEQRLRRRSARVTHHHPLRTQRIASKIHCLNRSHHEGTRIFTHNWIQEAGTSSFSIRAKLMRVHRCNAWFQGMSSQFRLSISIGIHRMVFIRTTDLTKVEVKRRSGQSTNSSISRHFFLIMQLLLLFMNYNTTVTIIRSFQIILCRSRRRIGNR